VKARIERENALFGESKKEKRKKDRHKNRGLINKEDFFSRNKCALFMYVAVSISCTSISFRWQNHVSSLCWNINWHVRSWWHFCLAFRWSTTLLRSILCNRQQFT